MKNILTVRFFFFSLGLLLSSTSLFGQEVTKVDGKVIDKETKEPLPFVSVYFKGSNVGVSTDLDGKYSIVTRFPTDTLVASFIGYTDLKRVIVRDEKQTIDFNLTNESLVMETVEVVAKKKKYKKKGNPAVELYKKVLANKGKNRIKGKEYYSYDKYEKIEMDLNNITEQFMDKRLLKKLDFVFSYVDTSDINGKPYLPLYLRETISKVYFEKKSDTEKEHREAVKVTDFDDLFDPASVDAIMDLLYQDIDIYDNIIHIINTQFVSPLAPVGYDFYRYYILDTTFIDGESVINLAFIPKNKMNFGFTGSLFITNDDNYFVKKVDMGIIGGINLNFVRDLKITQDFKKNEETFVLTRDRITVDYALGEKGLGIFGTRIANYQDYSFEKPQDMSVFSGVDKTIDEEGLYEKPITYWENNRFENLSSTESGVYEMIDSLNNNPTFKRVKTIGKIIGTGYIPMGPVDLGQFVTFVSFNDVEGTRLKLAGETNYKLASNFKLAGYGAYGTRDKTWKYSIAGTYSFNEDWKPAPRNFIYFEHSQDVTFPGVLLDFIKTDNVLLSIRRGRTDRMLFNKIYKAHYTKEGGTFDYTFHIEKNDRRPHGNLLLPFQGADGTEFLNSINTFEVGLDLKYAPNEKFVQGRTYRTPIFNEFPVFTMRYRKGIDGVLGGDYDYHRLSLNVFKRFHWSLFGHTNLELEAGKVWGDVPYILQHIPRANQTFAYQIRSFNMMNFMEFATDQYVTVNMQHFFQGYIFNRLPLLKKLKLREVITFKMVYGKMTDKNNPELNPSLVGFQTNDSGIPLTYALNGTPYIEGSVGVSNIFRVLRVDLVKRLNYLENPNVPELFNVKGLGIRARFKVDF